MIIQHNISASFANRLGGKNSNNKVKSMDKLSSGYKINKAADNAAGLSISEKMRGQIRGLDQASINIQDGASLIQVADGAMSEINAILNRMSELAVQAANDTNVLEDRATIQEEIKSLINEIDSITEKTEFNTIKVLQSDVTITYVHEVEGSLPSWIQTPPMGSLVDDLFSFSDAKDPSITYNHSGFSFDFSDLDNDSTLLDDLINTNTGFLTTCCTCNNRYSIKFVDSDESSYRSADSSNYMLICTFY